MVIQEKIDKWLSATCEYFTTDEIKIDRVTLLDPPDINRYILDARRVAMYLLYTHVGLRHRFISKMFNRDRSTIAYNIIEASNDFTCRMYVKDVEFIAATGKQEKIKFEIS